MGVTPVISLIIFFVQPNSATICSLLKAAIQSSVIIHWMLRRGLTGESGVRPGVRRELMTPKMHCQSRCKRKSEEETDCMYSVWSI